MSKKLINGVFTYAIQEKADSLVISAKNEQLCFDYHFSQSSSKTLVLPQKYKNLFFKRLYNFLSLAEDEIASNKESFFEFGGKIYDFQATIIPGQKENKIIIKFQWKKELNFRLSELGLSRAERKNILSSLQKNKSLFIITGDKASGKSTLIRALGRELSSSKKNICLFSNQNQDEIENINLVKLDKKTITSFEKHKADIIIIDEVQNPKDLGEALKLARNGYLVIASYKSKNLKHLAEEIKKIPSLNKELLKSLSTVVFSSLKKMDRQIEGKRDKRTIIGKFKIISFRK